MVVGGVAKAAEVGELARGVAAGVGFAEVEVADVGLSLVDWGTEEEGGRRGRREATRASRSDCRSVRVERRLASCVSGEMLRLVKGEGGIW